MEVGRRLARLEHGDRRGAEVEVERAGEALGQPGAAEVEMGDLAQGVDAGVGAAGGDHGDRLAGAGQHGGFDRRLDGRPSPWRCQPWNGVPSYSSSRR